MQKQSLNQVKSHFEAQVKLYEGYLLGRILQYMKDQNTEINYLMPTQQRKTIQYLRDDLERKVFITTQKEWEKKIGEWDDYSGGGMKTPQGGYANRDGFYHFTSYVPSTIHTSQEKKEELRKKWGRMALAKEIFDKYAFIRELRVKYLEDQEATIVNLRNFQEALKAEKESLLRNTGSAGLTFFECIFKWFENHWKGTRSQRFFQEISNTKVEAWDPNTQTNSV